VRAERRTRHANRRKSSHVFVFGAKSAGRRAMTIFQRALLREFAGLAGAVFLTLFAIAVTTRLIRLLGQAAGGKIPTDAVVAFLGFFSVGVLPLLLSVSLFVTVLVALTRSYRDSEMVVWFSSGLSLATWLKPVLTFALPTVAAIGALALFITPWAAQVAEQYRVRLESRDDVARVNPGVFGESRGRDRVFFVESVTDDRAQQVQNVFVSSVQQGQSGVVRSERGYTETAPNGDRFLVLEKGRRYEGEPGEAAYRVMEFERYATRIEAKESAQPVISHTQATTLALIENPTNANLGELVWRIGLPVSALILALLAIPMSFVNPRAGRSANLVYALLVYLVYSNLISVSQARVSQGKLDFVVGSTVVHVVMVLAALLLFAYRMRIPRR
jgi:lipopolysaccharide export system permease protein